MIRKFFKWVFAEELRELERKTKLLEDNVTRFQRIEGKLNKLFDNLDVSVDYHEYSPSWAVFSLQGEKNDFVKFVQLKDSDIREIMKIISHFEGNKTKIDAMPNTTSFIKMEAKRMRG